MSARSLNQRSHLRGRVAQTAERSSIVNYGHLLTWTAHPDMENDVPGRRLINIIQGRTIGDRIPRQTQALCFPGHWDSTRTPVPSAGTQHTLTLSRHLYTTPNTHEAHWFNGAPPTPSAPHTHTHTHANFTLGKCEACQPGSDAGTDGWREWWAMDIVAKAPLHVAVLEAAHPENRELLLLKHTQKLSLGTGCMPKSH